MRKLEWPDCEPPSQTDPHWKFNNNLCVNGTPYHKVEVAPGKWRWEINSEVLHYMRAREKAKRELFWALRSRVLTGDEMAEVGRLGDRLNIESYVPYNPKEKSDELNAALLQQFRLRAIAAAHRAPDGSP